MSRCATFKARFIRFETTASKIRSIRIKRRQRRADKFDALPNSGQSPRNQSNGAARHSIAIEFNVQFHRAVAVKYEDNGAACRARRANLRSRPRDDAPLAIRLQPRFTTNAKCASRHCKWPGNAFPADNGRFSFVPAAVRLVSIAARMRRPSRKCRLRGLPPSKCVVHFRLPIGESEQTNGVVSPYRHVAASPVLRLKRAPSPGSNAKRHAESAGMTLASHRQR
ncbi:hypothetical protein BTI_4548 [Burkholderia thailandensis MSMB121]|uniref:hypothetical protein n=1 Tax=Burkholderia humptydooensis TaxID=430531 RepID=UPI00032807EF|nr:hypothetical protein [Burkholderia humptydooensis]AGK51544.1 hypothetical protein BTI_4548 [Burkholderia thailandensis MSMB121]